MQSANDGDIVIPGKDGTNIMFRLYNPNSGEHFYTAAEAERRMLIRAGWRYEGCAWYAPIASDMPVYRLYSSSTGDHHYTTNAAERDMLINVGWNYEGIGWCSAESGESIYRVFNPNATGAGSHHYTSSAYERDTLINLGWKNEGIGWYGV